MFSLLHFGRPRFRVAVLAAVLATTFLVGACAGAEEAVPTATPTRAPIATPTPTSTPTPIPSPVAKKPSGSLVVAMTPTGQEGTLLHRGGDGPTPSRVIYEFLTSTNLETVTYGPMLATGWDVSADFKTWTFYLRKGVPYHRNQGEFTAEDVKYSYDLVMDPQAKTSIGPSLRSIIDRIEVVDPYTITVHMKSVQPLFDWMNSDIYDDSPTTMNKHYIEAVGDEKAEVEAVGTGPYMLVEWRRGEFMRFEALDKHWRVVPEYKSLTLRFIPEPSTRLAMLLTGEADIAEIPRNLIKQAKSGGMVMVNTKLQAFIEHASFEGIWFPTRDNYNPKNPFLDIRVRKALNLAIDREEIRDVLFVGQGTLSVIPNYAEGLPGWDPNLKPYPYDPDEARRLLDEAGYGPTNPLEVTWYSFPKSGLPENAQIGEVFALQWGKVGVKVKVIMQESEAILSTWRRGWDARLSATATGFAFVSGYRPDVARQVRQKVKGDGTMTVDSQVILDLVKEIDQTVDMVKRDQLLRQVGREIYDNYYQIPLLDLYFTNAVNPKKVGFWEPAGGGGATLTRLEYIRKP